MTEAAWTLPTPERFRLAPTVLSHGAFQCAPFHWDGDEERLTRVLRIGGVGPRIVEIDEELRTRVEVVEDPERGARPAEVRRMELRLRMPGGAADDDVRAEVEEAAVFMLGLDRPLHRFHELCRSDPALSRIPRIGAGRLLRCPGLWEELVKAICGRGGPWVRAVSRIEAIARLGEPVEGLHAWPDPARVVDVGEAELAERMGADDEAAQVIELARRIHSGALDPAPAESGLLGREEMARFFRSVSGIDAATADHLLTLYGHADRLPLDDAAVTFLRDRHFGGRTPTEAEIRERYERYGEWKALAYWFDFVQEIWWPALDVRF